MKLTRQIKTTYGTEFQNHLFQQYKLYVEMAERVSGRRMLANSFFLSVNAALVATFVVLIKEKIIQLTFLGILPLTAVIILCVGWLSMIRSYRQLNTAKFKVIHELEQMLPVALYYEEWIALGAGKDRKKYVPLTNVEDLVPICFGLIYFFMFFSIVSYN